MKDFFTLLVHVLSLIAKMIRPGGYRAVIAESILLKQQLIVLNRGHYRSPRLSAWDRLLLGFTASFISTARIAKYAVAIKPSTILGFHRALVQRKYSKLYGGASKNRKTGPVGPSHDVIQAILEIKRANPRYGCRQIADLINNSFGTNIDKDLVRRVLNKHYFGSTQHPSGGPSWLTLLSQCKDSLWSVDFFRCESIALKSFYVMVVMDVFTRRIIGFSVQPANLDGIAVCRMFNKLISGKQLPRYLSSDNDPLFTSYRWIANLSILGIEEIKSVPYTPVSHPFIERLIGTVRREYLDHTLFWNQRDLERKLDRFKDYYNNYRVHHAIAGITPAEKSDCRTKSLAHLSNYALKSHCNGLFKTPIPA